MSPEERGNQAKAMAAGVINDLLEGEKANAPKDERKYLQEEKDALIEDLKINSLQNLAKTYRQSNPSFINDDEPSDAVSFTSTDDSAKQAAEIQAIIIKELGFEPEVMVTTTEEGVVYDVRAEMPEGFKNENPLTMPPERLKEAQEAQGNDESKNKKDVEPQIGDWRNYAKMQAPGTGRGM
mgnify:CR=1 FL=1